MLRRLTLRDFVIVRELELDFKAGFSVLTGETGAGKSILIDALQLALGGRGEAGVLREGAQRAEMGAEFDTPATLRGWLDEAGFAVEDTILLRRAIDAQGRSRAWINGSAATIAQLRAAADHLVDIHGQHAWQSLTRPESVRALLDAQAGVSDAEVARRFSRWQQATQALAEASARGDDLARERERLVWQLGEIDRLAPAESEWLELNQEHTRRAHAQALIDAARVALDALVDADANAHHLTSHATDALAQVAAFDERLAPVVKVLQGALAELDDAAHSLKGYLGHVEMDPARLAELDARLSAWLGLARRFRHPPQDLPQLQAQWRAGLAALDAATDLDGLERTAHAAEQAWREEAQRLSQARQRAALPFAQTVTQAMQGLGMAGGRLELVLLPQDRPQAFGLESAELRVAAHAGSTPRPVAKVASGGELSRLALAIAVTSVRTGAQAGAAAPTLIFDEIDAGIGGAVADIVGAQMKALGRGAQVLAVTHLAQVASQADQHFTVAKFGRAGRTECEVRAVSGEARVAEVARMLGGERQAGTSLAHAQALLQGAQADPT